MAVPGPITSQQSAGCHTIIRDWGGTLVTGAADVLEMVTPLGETPGDQPAQLELLPDNVSELAVGAAHSRAAGDPAASRPKPVLPRDALDLESATVLDALPLRGGIGTTAVAARAGLAPATVVRCLGTLAAGGFAERCEGGWRARRP
jgi:DNA processing protein